MYVTGCWLLPLYDAFWNISERPAIVHRPAEQERVSALYRACRTRALTDLTRPGWVADPQALAETPHAEVQDEYAAVTTNRSGEL